MRSFFCRGGAMTRPPPSLTAEQPSTKPVGAIQESPADAKKTTSLRGADRRRTPGWPLLPFGQFTFWQSRGPSYIPDHRRDCHGLRPRNDVVNFGWSLRSGRHPLRPRSARPPPPVGEARIFRCRRHRGNGTEAVPYRIVTKTPAFRRALHLFQGIDGLPCGLYGGGGGVLAVEFAGHGQAHGHALALEFHGAGLGSLGT